MKQEEQRDYNRKYYAKNRDKLRAKHREYSKKYRSERQKITGETSDGYHTFNELYEHRHWLFMNMLYLVWQQNHSSNVWKSKQHHDGTMYDNWFIAGIDTVPGKQITYHLPIKYWDVCPGEVRENAPEFDGHTSQDVTNRLRKRLEYVMLT